VASRIAVAPVLPSKPPPRAAVAGHRNLSGAAVRAARRDLRRRTAILAARGVLLPPPASVARWGADVWFPHRRLRRRSRKLVVDWLHRRSRLLGRSPGPRGRRRRPFGPGVQSRRRSAARQPAPRLAEGSRSGRLRTPVERAGGAPVGGVPATVGVRPVAP